jgi:hypothetical protein
VTDVYLRHVDEVEGVKVGEVPFTDTGFDEAVRLVKSWGSYVDGYDLEQFNSAQLRLSEGRAYFEIILGEDE